MWNKYDFNIDHMSRAYEYADLLDMWCKMSAAAAVLDELLHTMKRTDGTCFAYAMQLQNQLHGFAESAREAKNLQLEREFGICSA
jgi:hypothetical protein